MMDAFVLPIAGRVVDGEERLRAAIAAHYDVVGRFLRRMGVPHDAVEDAAQQVLIVFSNRIDSVDVGAERSFLLGTALRVAADFRKQVARQREVADEGALLGWAGSHVDPGDALDERRARRVLEVVLRRMPEELRSVLVMCDLEELTMADVAASLAIPPGTVASRLRRARASFHDIAGEVRKERAAGLRGAVSGLVFVLLLVAFGVATLQTQALAARDAAQGETRRLDALLQVQSKQAAQIEAELQKELVSEKDPSAITDLKERLEVQQQWLKALQSKGVARPFVGPPPMGGGGAKAACSCVPGDALCSCL
jgi:RNA polymerase sigma-70 factor (ECF subfamily)